MKRRRPSGRSVLARENACLQLVERIGLVANQVGDRDDILKSALGELCAFAACEVGHVTWIEDTFGAAQARPSGVEFLAASEETLTVFAANARKSPPKGVGALAARAMAERRPVLGTELAELLDETQQRSATAARIRSALALPLFIGESVVAVVELFARGELTVDEPLYRALESVGVLLGRVVERARWITERIEAATELEKRRKQLDEAHAIAQLGSWEWEIASDTIAWSEGLYRIYGLAPSDLHPSFEGFLERVHGADRAHLEAVVRHSYETGAPFSTFHRIVRPDGSVRMIHARGHVHLGPSGKPVRMTGTGQDVTEQVEAEQRKHELAIEQERAKVLEQRNRELQDFAYVASHDLKEPLRTILGYLDLIQHRYAGLLDDDGREFITFVVEAAHRMEDLLDDLLTLSRVTTQARPHELVSLEEVFGEVCDNLASAIEEAGADIRSEPLPTVSADRTQMMQLFQNLLSNALKFRGERPARVEVSARTAGKNYEITVRDHGIGIDGKHAQRIFAPFQRLHGHEIAGTGIGLTICQRIVERHGGRIAAEPAEGQGAAFRFTLPVP